MMMPTPVVGSSNTQSLMMPGQQGQDGQPAMAFTYVPVPVYNMGGVSLPGMIGGAPQVSLLKKI